MSPHEIGLADDIDDYMKMHIDSIIKENQGWFW